LLIAIHFPIVPNCCQLCFNRMPLSSAVDLHSAKDFFMRTGYEITAALILRLCVPALNGLTTAMPKSPIYTFRLPRHVAPLSVRLLTTLVILLAASAPAADEENPGAEGDGKITIGPEYKIDPDLTERGNPKGKAFEFSRPLADSKIFRGDDSTLEPEKKAVRKERKIFVYVPAAYHDGDKAPLLIIHDGPGQLKLVRNALDNLTTSKDPNRKLPAFIAIAVENGGNDGKNSERGLEYDTMSDRLARFVHDEVLPAVLNNAEIKAAFPKLAFTENPSGRAVMGCSSGGAAALSMAWFRPDWFGRVIAYSGTFVDQQDDDAAEEAKYPLGAWEYHSSMKLIEASPKKPLRIFTHVSENDLRPRDPEETHHNWVMAGERTAAALKAKGYHQRFVFSLGTNHCDRRVFEQTLADTLVWIWRGYHE
jgi:enterochelin esterase family protein